METTTINQRIGVLIQHEKLTANSFATKLGIKATVVYNILKGRNKPSFDVLVKVMETFQISPSWLFTGEGNIKKGAISNDIIPDAKNDILDEEELTKALTKLANSDLLYLEFHLRDILINLRLLHEKATGESFDRNAVTPGYANIETIMSFMREGLKTGSVSNKNILNTLLDFDDLIRIYLDAIRSLSSQVYLHFSKPVK